MPDFDKHLRLMFDLIVAAFQADMTRIASYMMAAEVSNQSYAHVGVPDAFHPLSHHAESKAAMEKLVIVQRYHTQVFTEFLQKLEKIPDGDAGSVLDSSIFLYGSNMSNSNVAQPVPVADARARPRRGHDQGRPAPRVSRPHAARESIAHAAASAPAFRSTRSATASAR